MSANSIIRFYQNTATTANSSRAEISKYGSGNSPGYINTPDSQVIDSGDSGALDSAQEGVILQKIENLPTAPVLEDSPQLSNRSPTKLHTNSAIPSLFSIPLRFFNGRKSSPVEEDERELVEDDNIDLRNVLPIDVIQDSALVTEYDNEDCQSVERTNSELLKRSSQASGLSKHFLDELDEFDPIYDNYINYLNHTADEDGQGEPQDDELSSRIDVVNQEIDTPDKIDIDVTYKRGDENASTTFVGNLYDFDFNIGESTLQRITSKTKHLFRQLSNKYSSKRPQVKAEVELTNKAPEAQWKKAESTYSHPSSFRIGLKRRFSSVSIRRHGSIRNWKWPKLYDDTVNEQKPAHNSDGSTVKDGDGLECLADLFKSDDFVSRISLGSVCERKSYEEQELNNNYDYQIFYQSTSEASANEQEHETTENDGGGSIHDTLAYLKDQTIRGTRSLQRSFVRYLAQEVEC